MGSSFVNGPAAFQTLSSTVAGDPDLAPFLPQFVADLPTMVSRLEGLLAANDSTQLRQLLHKIKGVGGIYGFDPITDAAERAETAVRLSAGFDAICAELEILIGLIRSVEGYHRAGEFEMLGRSAA